MLENTEGTMKNGQARETGNLGNTQTKQKHNTICVGHHYAQTNTDNVNKRWTPLQTTGNKDELNVVSMWESQRTTQHGTQNVKTPNVMQTWIIKIINDHYKDW